MAFLPGTELRTKKTRHRGARRRAVQSRLNCGLPCRSQPNRRQRRCDLDAEGTVFVGFKQFSDLDRYPKNAEVPFAEYLKTRLKHQDDSVDGILCWNFFDYLDLASANALATALKKVLRPDGTVLSFFTTVATADTRFSKYVIMNEDTVTQRPYSSRGKKQTSFQNRDIIRMFDGLKVAESFLLKTNVREFLFRKPI